MVCFAAIRAQLISASIVDPPMWGMMTMQNRGITEVGVVLAQTVFCQGFSDSLVVNDPQAGKIEQDSVWLHLRDLGVSNQASRLLVLWHVGGHKVRVLNGVSDAGGPLDMV